MIIIIPLNFIWTDIDYNVCDCFFLSCQIPSQSGLSFFVQGVNRAFPFVSSNEADDIVDIQTPVLFQLVITNLLA